MYTEEQKITSQFVKIALIIGILISIISVIIFAVQAPSNGTEQNDLYIAVAIIVITFIIVYAAIFRTSVEISLDDYRITISYFPFLRKPLIIEYTNIVSWQHRKLNGIFDYGGYGYKKDFLQKKTGFIMGGKYVFEFKLLNGKKIGFTAANTEMMLNELVKQLPNKQLK